MFNNNSGVSYYCCSAAAAVNVSLPIALRGGKYSSGASPWDSSLVVSSFLVYALWHASRNIAPWGQYFPFDLRVL